METPYVAGRVGQSVPALSSGAVRGHPCVRSPGAVRGRPTYYTRYARTHMLALAWHGMACTARAVRFVSIELARPDRYRPLVLSTAAGRTGLLVPSDGGRKWQERRSNQRLLLFPLGSRKAAACSDADAGGCGGRPVPGHDNSHAAAVLLMLLMLLSCFVCPSVRLRRFRLHTTWPSAPVPKRALRFLPTCTAPVRVQTLFFF